MFRSKKLRKTAAMLVTAMLMFLGNNFVSVAQDINVALISTPSTSYCSPWESIYALNDGYDPAHSNDRSHLVYGNWNNPGTTQWVQYDFPGSYTISRCDVYWFDDDQGIDLPASCAFKYWDGSNWVPVSNPQGLGVLGNQFNITTFTPVTTTRIRLEITAKPNYSTGILEWKVWGSPAGGSGDLVAHYKFDETSGTQASDSSGNGRHATLNGGATWVSGKIGNAVNLSGSNQYVSMPTGIISGLNDFTIAAWVKLDTRSDWVRIFDFGTGTGYYMFLTPSSSAGTVRFAIKNGGSEQQINSTSPLPTGVWKHVAVTLSGNTGRLYIDGVLAGTNSNITIKPSNLPTTNLNYIGRSMYSYDPYLDGQVDDFRIYNRALSASEIIELAGGSGSGSYEWDYGNVPGATFQTWNPNPNLTPININPYGQPAYTIARGYILLNEGPNGPNQVPLSTQAEILERINEDLRFEVENLGVHMPPWCTGQTGNKYIDYFFTNTGFPNDPGATGWQGWEGSYPMVATDANGMSQQNRWNLTHEFNHVLLNSYGTIPGNWVSWIHESLNNYMILRLCQWRLGGYPGQPTQFPYPSGIGYLNREVYNQPYVPIESCGINSSGEATAPNDYYNDSTGYRYNDLFPLFVSQRVGYTFFFKVIEEARTNEQILQTMTRLLDKQRVQSMVVEYAARLALGDFMEFSSAVQGVATTNMYTVTTNQGGWLVPTNSNKLPRYTGRNFIPISVNSGATSVTVNFSPDATGSNGTPADMRCQIAYRATDGTTIFSTPVASGQTTIQLTKPPKNNVVIVVITNVTMSGYKRQTSYGWDPTERFGYKIQVTGGTPAPTNQKYF